MNPEIQLDNVYRPAPPALGFSDVGDGLDLDADVVIVGSGPGGSAAALALAQAGARVVVVEEGPRASRFRPNQAHTARHHMYEQGTVVSRGNGFIGIAAGRGVGGGTLINSALCFRCPDEVLDGWAALLDDEGYRAQALGPLFDEVSALIGVTTTGEGIAGENNRLIARGIAALGWDGGLAPRNAGRCVGCGVCNFGCPSGGKASANLTLLPRAVDLGATILAETRVTAILEEDGRAVGIAGQAFDPETQSPGGTVHIRAPRVIASAGALGTPRLLHQAGLASRLGPVGRGLHIHPGSAVLGVCDEEIRMWTGATQGAYVHPPSLPGVLPHTLSAPPEAILGILGLVGPRLEEGLNLLPRFAGMVVMVSDKGEGTVRATRDGRTDVRYDFAADDLERTKRGMVAAARILLEGGARSLRVPVYGVGEVDSPDELGRRLADRPLGAFSLYASHPMSTCRMSKDPGTGVVAPDGQCHGLPGLFIADASVFPTSLGVNPQLTTMALATVIGRRIAAGVR